MGGSFNPAHQGHLAMTLHALRRLQLDQVWWLVSPQNPLKPEKGMASLVARMSGARNMTRHPRILVTDIEDQLGTRYTVDTLKQLKRRFPHTNFIWLMGADNLKQLPRWKKWQEIFALVPVAVFRRPNYAAGRGLGKVARRFSRNWRSARNAKNLAQQQTPVWLILDNQLNILSATSIRQQR